jgi:hypothetical protein
MLYKGERTEEMDRRKHRRKDVGIDRLQKTGKGSRRDVKIEGKTEGRKNETKEWTKKSKGMGEDRKDNVRIIKPVVHAAQTPRALCGAATHMLWL